MHCSTLFYVVLRYAIPHHTSSHYHIIKVMSTMRVYVIHCAKCRAGTTFSATHHGLHSIHSAPYATCFAMHRLLNIWLLCYTVRWFAMLRHSMQCYYSIYQMPRAQWQYTSDTYKNRLAKLNHIRTSFCQDTAQSVLCYWLLCFLWILQSILYVPHMFLCVMSRATLCEDRILHWWRMWIPPCEI